MLWYDAVAEAIKHRAPKGALRQLEVVELKAYDLVVRKHRAPNGALILRVDEGGIRGHQPVRKRRAPKCALRHRLVSALLRVQDRSESTKRHKVY